MTEDLLRYREAARHLWNAHLRPPSSLDDELFHAWEGIKKHLYAALVSRNLDLGEQSVWVVPVASEVPAMVSRMRPAKDVLGSPRQAAGTHGRPVFIDFFDFDELGEQDFMYFRVAIRASKSGADLVGHEALIEVQHARVFVED